jgi:hypothetical protein
MKRFWEALAVIAAIIVGWFFFFGRTPTQGPDLLPAGSPAQSGTGSKNASNSPAASNPQNVFSSNSVSAVAPAPNDLASRAASPGPGAGANAEPALPPLTVLDKARVVIHNYHSAFGENPVGTNPEITAALMGKNPKQINFVADSGLRVNEKGELVDAYGTPFFFHQISGQEMEIRSAGQDRVMWTYDDLVTK